jgi:hypothetical protein
LDRMDRWVATPSCAVVEHGFEGAAHVAALRAELGAALWGIAGPQAPVLAPPAAPVSAVTLSLPS